MISYSDHIAQLSMALADPTRREIMELVMDSEKPLSVREVANQVGLHANAARMHLDKLVMGGLLQVIRQRENRGGRPAHLYCASDEDYELHLPPRQYKLLAEIMAKWIYVLDEEVPQTIKNEAFRCGREEAMRSSSPLAFLPSGAKASRVIEAWMDGLRSRGLKAKLSKSDGLEARMIFLSCPFGELSRHYPGIICEIHRCLEEGFLSLAGEWQVKANQEETGCTFALHGKRKKQ